MDYSILIMSCDKYVELLDIFFKYFVRFYDTSNTKVYVSLEKSEYINTQVDITVLNYYEALGWSHRLKKCLEYIDTKAVLILLDDFIIESKADTKEIERLSRLIARDEGIAHFALTTVPMKNESNTLFYNNYYKRYRFGRYKTTLQAGIWNKDELISILSDRESPWEVEIYANYRSFLSSRSYYALSDQKLKPIDYNDGFFCLQGKINELERERLEKKFNEKIKINTIPSNNGVIIRNDTTLIKRVKGRIKIIFYYMLYRCKFLWKNGYGKK